MSHVTIPKARVSPKPDGTLRFNQWEGARQPDDEGWWNNYCVILAPRRPPKPTSATNTTRAGG